MTRSSSPNPATPPRTEAADPAVLPPSGDLTAGTDDEHAVAPPPNPEANEPL
jgi:hypothetical protein